MTFQEFPINQSTDSIVFYNLVIFVWFRSTSNSRQIYDINSFFSNFYFYFLGFSKEKLTKLFSSQKNPQKIKVYIGKIYNDKKNYEKF